MSMKKTGYLLTGIAKERQKNAKIAFTAVFY
jgi:hypothetical protein